MLSRVITLVLVAIAVSATLQPSPSIATDGRWMGEAVIERTGRGQCPTKWQFGFVTADGKVSGKIWRSKLYGKID